MEREQVEDRLALVARRGWVRIDDATAVAMAVADEVRRDERAKWMAYVEEQLAKLRSALT